MVAGFGLALAWPALYDPVEHGGIEIYNLPLAFTVALLINIIVSLFTGSSTGPQPCVEAAPSARG